MSPAPGRFARCSAFVLAAAFLGSGCVAFNVGEPETFTHTDRIAETATAPLRTEILSANAQLQKNGAEAVVGLGVAVQEEFEKREHAETVTVRTRKRLAVGLFPGAAEFLFVPEGALQPDIDSTWARKTGDPPRGLYDSDPRNGMGHYVGHELLAAFVCGIPLCLSTLNSLFYAPFDDWRCGGHEFVDPARVVKYGDVYDADSPKLRALLRFSNAERNRIGINTCLHQIDKYVDRGTAGVSFATHTGLVGIHKHLVVFVDGPTVGPSIVVGTEKKQRRAFAGGPFIAEFKIPDLNHDDWKRVAPGETQATFALPAVERDCTVEVVVSFREDASVSGGGADDLAKRALAKAAGREWRFDLALQGSGRPQPPQPPPEQPFKVVTIKPMGDGQYLVRVEVKDQSKTFSILHLIKPEVYRLVREDFRSKNPDEPAQYVRESMRYETEQDGKLLSFTGWVFSVRPIQDGWSYDAESRRGWVRLRIVGGIPATEAESWAHENIGEIVKYKNVVIEEGKAPPPGATYRSLDEKFENGVLTVEFEAVQ